MKFKGAGTQKVPNTTTGRGGGKQGLGGSPDAATTRPKNNRIPTAKSRRASPTNGGDKQPYDRGQTKEIAGELQNRLRARARGRMAV